MALEYGWFPGFDLSKSLGFRSLHFAQLGAHRRTLDVRYGTSESLDVGDLTQVAPAPLSPMSTVSLSALDGARARPMRKIAVSFGN
jgi:hypothetical protein